VAEGLQFASPAWLLLLALIPAVGVLQRRARRAAPEARRERDYADAALLPHLAGTARTGASGAFGQLLAWSVPWTLAVLAFAGPRWDYEQVQVFEPGAGLVVLLDISRSMEAGDVSPTRLARARQEIEDLLNVAEGLRIGLVAFASVATVVSPVTDDTASVRRTLPALGPDLVRLQGSRPAQAIARGRQLLATQPADAARNLLLISDGDFQDLELDAEVAALRDQGIRLHVLAIGTPQGAPVIGPQGRPLLERTGSPVVSRLNATLLGTIAAQTGGEYQAADYRDDDVRAIARAAAASGRARKVGDERLRVWHEPFWWFLAPAALWLLFEFRRRAAVQPVSRPR
jgi:Ca-activated chloride channel family protein